MKKLIIIILTVCFSCKEKQTVNTCEVLERKHDSLFNKQKELENKVFFKFYNVLQKENGSLNDTILIASYNSLIGQDSLIDLYLWDRIHTIKQNINKSDVYETFKGTYSIKPIHNKDYVQATKIVIRNDSCFVYKQNNLIVKQRFNLINSSNRYIKGKLRLKNFKLLLDGAIESKLVIHLEDNGCMDCERLEFYKT